MQLRRAGAATDRTSNRILSVQTEAPLMKRDVDFIRHLLFDIERHGVDCTFDVLRNGSSADADQRTQYHVRLLVDAGLAKDVDRKSGGPSVRLTSEGHEFIELCRSDLRWREAKWFVQEQTGGLSIAVLRAVLTKWAIDAITRSDRARRWRRPIRPRYYRGEPGYRVDSYRYEREPFVDEELVQIARARAAYRDRVEQVDDWSYAADGPLEESISEDSLGVSLPVHMI
jgi:Hypothetical protein (DUF2513)